MALTIENRFEVPLPRSETWTLLFDLDRLAGCMPGAVLAGQDAEGFAGTMDVRLGPVALTFQGRGRFEETDAAAFRMVVSGQGSDARGRGRASARVELSLEEAPGGATLVKTSTDVTLSGSIAQYGRGAGMIRAVSEELTAQFAENLRASLAEIVPTATASAELSGLALLWGGFKRWVRRLFGAA